MQQIILIFHILFAVALIALVLLQQGKGSAVGGSFGGGASQTMFGSRGANSFLLKLTGGLAILFFATSLTLGYFSNRQIKPKNDIVASAVELSKAMPQAQPQQKKSLKNKHSVNATVNAINASLDAGTTKK